MTTLSGKNDEPAVKGMYVMAFTLDEIGPDWLKSLVHVADEMLRAKDPAFKQLMEERMAPTTPIEIASLRYVPIMHTPQTMQTTLAGWLKKRYAVVYAPTVGKNFFPHGMRDPHGKETYVLFYFDLSKQDSDHQAG